MNGDGAPDIRYSYSYDPLGRLATATGAYARGTPDTITYEYDHLDHQVHYLQTRGWGDTRLEITAEYDTLGDLLDYAYVSSPGGLDHYTFSGFTDTGQPTHEVASYAGQITSYDFDYDGLGRVAHISGSDGGATTYAYDDGDARTITIDSESYHAVVVYDLQNHELSETWSGLVPGAYDLDTRFTYDGDRVLTIAVRQGSVEAPHALATVEIDTLRYDCAGP
jgi:hypothetical protein